MAIRKKLDESVLENVSGGAFVADPEGTNEKGEKVWVMTAQFSKRVFHNITFAQLMEISAYAASQPDTEEGEKNIIEWAEGKQYF